MSLSFKRVYFRLCGVCSVVQGLESESRCSSAGLFAHKHPLLTPFLPCPLPWGESGPCLQGLGEGLQHPPQGCPGDTAAEDEKEEPEKQKEEEERREKPGDYKGSSRGCFSTTSLGARLRGRAGWGSLSSRVFERPKKDGHLPAGPLGTSGALSSQRAGLGPLCAFSGADTEVLLLGADI